MLSPKKKKKPISVHPFQNVKFSANPVLKLNQPATRNGAFMCRCFIFFILIELLFSRVTFVKFFCLLHM